MTEIMLSLFCLFTEKNVGGIMKKQSGQKKKEDCDVGEKKGGGKAGRSSGEKEQKEGAEKKKDNPYHSRSGSSASAFWGSSVSSFG